MIKIPTPTELNSIQEAKDESFFKQVVEILISRLQWLYVNGGTVSVNITASLVNERIIKRVIKEFGEKDWIVHFGPIQDDQRDGDFYSVRIQAKTGH